MRVLVVEDDTEMRQLLSRLLEGDGYEVATASSGAGAVAEVVANEPDLVSSTSS